MLNLTIIDDDRDFTKTLSVYLTKHFPQIKIFQPISETNTIKLAIKNFHTDIVIADVKNPIVNGVEIVKNFKKEKNPAKFILLDSENNFFFAKEAVKEGVFDYLTKPLDYDELSETIKRLEISLKNKTDQRPHSIDDVRPMKDRLFSDLLAGRINNSAELSLRLRDANLEASYAKRECALINIHIDEFSRWLAMCWDSGLDSFYQTFSNSVLKSCNNFEFILARVFYNNIEILCINNAKKPLTKYMPELIPELSKKIMDTFSVYSEIHTSRLFSSVSEIIKFNMPEFTKIAPDPEKIIENAKKFIHHNYFREITLDEVANYVMLSREYFCSYYKQKTGENFLETLNKHRIEASKKYLLTTNLTINQVAERVGYRSSSHYHKLFRKYNNISPNEYRKAH